MRIGLTATRPDPGRALAPLAGVERLNAADRPPIALALSGGGDSLALLHLAKAWADADGRTLVALTVDHRLQPASSAWSRFAADRAGSLGVDHRTLAWFGAKPRTGLPAAARAARHALLADAARSAGARVILMAHTADDLAEAELMRERGASTPSPRLWSPSPAWPEGRGVFLLRPLIGHRRADLRAMLVAIGETWIDDPANDDPRFSRSLARRELAERRIPAPPAEATPSPSIDLRDIRPGLGGELFVPRSVLVANEARRRLVAALAVCAAGASRPPTVASLDRLIARLGGGDFIASLAGARIEARGDEVMFCREVGERGRTGLAIAKLAPGESVFDGRFLISCGQSDLRIGAMTGFASRLPRSGRDQLNALAPAVRRAAPAVIAPTGEVSCPLFGSGEGVSARPLAMARLRGALGAIADEATAAGA